MPKSSDKNPHLPRLNGQRILVVADNSNTAALARQTLISAGAGEVATAPDGPDALRRLASFQPDVLITDLDMPGMDGLELTRTVRQSALAPHADVPDPAIPIVLFSAFASRASVRTARSAGIDAFVITPFSIGSLIKRVNRASRRTAEFIVHPSYVGPDRRTRAGAGRQRLTDPPAAANESQPEPHLRLSLSGERGPEEADSLLMELYEHIRALEAERDAQRAETRR